MQRILLFKKDVETYKKNYEKLHHQARCDHSFSFDDWCDMMGEARFKSGHSRQRQAKSQAVNNVLYQAFKTLELPWTATPEEVKRQFRKLTLKHHPDLPDGCEETMKKILSAYEEVQRSWKLAGQYTDVAG